MTLRSSRSGTPAVYGCRVDKGIRGLVLAVLTLVAGPRCRREAHRDSLAVLADVASTSRLVRARLAPPFGYAPLASPNRGMSPDPNAARLRALAAESVTSPDPHVAGIAALFAGQTTRSVDLLRRAALRGSADAWTDLSAALMEEGEQHGMMTPLVDALVAAERARRIEPRNAAASFDRALALERLGLLSEARDAWTEYRSIDSSSGWANEAAAAVRRIDAEVWKEDWQRDRGQLEAAADAGDSIAVRRLVRIHPRDARAWGESIYTSGWAEAFKKGDGAAADRQLKRARLIGDALVGEWDERLLRDAVRAIDAAPPANRQIVADAYLQYRSARIEYSKSAAAPEHLRASAALFARAGSPMEWVARYYEGSALYGEQRLRPALDVLDGLARLPLEARGYRALDAQIGWERGLATLSLGRFSTALEIFDRSRKVFDALGDVPDSATMRNFMATTYESAGDVEQAWKSRSGALRQLASEADAPRRMLVILGAGSAMVRREQWDQALPLLGLVIERTERTKDVSRLCTALSCRSAALAAIGDEGGARADLALLRQHVVTISDPAMQSAVQVDAHYAEALLLDAHDPQGAIAELSVAIGDVERAERALFRSRLRLQRARIERRIGRADAAHADILAGLEQTEANRSTISDEALRAMATVSEERLFAEGIDLAMERGDIREAFELAERMRARSLLELFEERTGTAVRTPLSIEAMQARLAPDAAIVEYAAVHERLLTFVLTPGDLRAFVKPVGADALRDLAVASAAAVRERGDRSPIRAASAILLEPIAAALSGVRHVAIVPDRRMTFVPFVALQDATQQLLIDRMTITIAPSASLAIECSRRASAARGFKVLSIGATEFDRRRFSNLAALPTVADEARNVATTYGGGELVIGSDASVARVRSLLPAANIVHFAGHSIAPPYDGNASTLVLAPGGTDDSLTARDIAQLQLRHARFVMLSSCRSARAGTAGDGVENLATAFLVAGVPSVIGASWDVDDESAGEIASAIHREYRVDGDSARAYQAAVSNPTIRSNDRWATVTPFGGSPSLVKKGEKE
jgi:CHAT domain-containing protein